MLIVIMKKTLRKPLGIPEWRIHWIEFHYLIDLKSISNMPRIKTEMATGMKTGLNQLISQKISQKKYFLGIIYNKNNIVINQNLTNFRPLSSHHLSPHIITYPLTSLHPLSVNLTSSLTSHHPSSHLTSCLAHQLTTVLTSPITWHHTLPLTSRHSSPHDLPPLR